MTGHNHASRQSPGRLDREEPPVTSWPHVLSGLDTEPSPDALAHYLCCSLSYQNQLLAEIKTLLEQLTADRPSSPSQQKK